MHRVPVTDPTISQRRRHGINRPAGVAVAVAALVALSALPAEAACSVGRFQFQFGAAKSIVMNVTRGSLCPIILNPGATISFEKLQLVSAPRHGRVLTDNAYGISFVPGNAYVGPDAFSFLVAGRDGGTAGTALIEVQINIQ